MQNMTGINWLEHTSKSDLFKFNSSKIDGFIKFGNLSVVIQEVTVDGGGGGGAASHKV